MKYNLIARKVTLKKSSEELDKHGDYCIIDKLGSSDEKIKGHQAMILKCPYCRMDMATTSIHKITFDRSWWQKLCGQPTVPTVSHMIQCPYIPSHKFKIKKGKIIEA